MTDREKLALIGTIIADFWGYSSDDKITAGAEAIVVAINSVVEFENEKP